jgi:hypothetical protein
MGKINGKSMEIHGVPGILKFYGDASTALVSWFFQAVLG